MPSKTLGSRLRPAALTVLALLLAAAGCSSPSQPGAAPNPTPTSNPGPSTAAPGPARTPKNTAPPPATTPVPPPTPGDVNSTVPTRPQESKKPVTLDKPSETGTGLAARLTSIKAITAKAQLPGEVAGPALAITLEVTNRGDEPADLNSVVVTVLDSDKAPGGEMSSSPAKPLTGSLKSGQAARGVYVFTMPKSKRKPITVDLTIGDAPVLVFTGNVD